MKLNALPRTPAELRADRELQLKDFIEAGTASLTRETSQSILLIARSPDSAAAAALLAVSGTLAQRGISARIVFISAEAGTNWNLSFSPGFCHEVRLGTDFRLLDAHEQLVIGDCAVWFGDSMRREPERRDAFIHFSPANAELARRGRFTFEALWEGCKPLYRHSFQAVAEAAKDIPADAVGETPAAVAGEVIATLDAWQPSSRH